MDVRRDSIVGLILLITLGCGPQVKRIDKGVSPKGQLVPFGIVLVGDEAQGALLPCSRVGPANIGVDGTWVPTWTDIHHLEQGVGGFLATFGDDAPSQPLDQYRRQYVGFVRDGRRLIYASFFPRDECIGYPEGRYCWQLRPITVCDGGDRYFGVEFDPKARSFSEYSTNGFA